MLSLAIFLLAVCAPVCRAADLNLNYSPIRTVIAPLFGWLDERDPGDVPPPFRTNCSFHNGRFYCAYRCGTDYQFYYCSRAAYGCCHIGDGYCDDHGYLRCRP